jgi:hypothetical protein
VVHRSILRSAVASVTPARASPNSRSTAIATTAFRDTPFRAAYASAEAHNLSDIRTLLTLLEAIPQNPPHGRDNQPARCTTAFGGL